MDNINKKIFIVDDEKNRSFIDDFLFNCCPDQYTDECVDQHIEKCFDEYCCEINK